VECPATIDVRQQLTTLVQGWTSSEDDVPHRLARITFYDGTPEERASLIPDASHKAGDRETTVWRFMWQTDRRIWLSCSYGSTTIALARALPAGTRACSVVYNLRQRVDGLPVIERISCE
jgi:hypothetical protein